MRDLLGLTRVDTQCFHIDQNKHGTRGHTPSHAIAAGQPAQLERST